MLLWAATTTQHLLLADSSVLEVRVVLVVVIGQRACMCLARFWILPAPHHQSAKHTRTMPSSKPVYHAHLFIGGNMEALMHGVELERHSVVA